MRYILIIVVLTLSACKISKVEKYQLLNGSFYNREIQREIHFNRDDFLLSNSSPYDEVDTLSYGSYIIKDNLLELSSSKEIFNDHPKIVVKEFFSGFQDSIYIIIDNPEIGFTVFRDNVEKLIPYSSYTFNSHHFNKSYSKSDLFSKRKTIYKNSNISVFSLTIVPNVLVYPSDIYKNTFQTIDYKPKNIANNTFLIKIDFNWKQFAYKEFRGEYVKIINSDTLMWDNELFIKELK